MRKNKNVKDMMLFILVVIQIVLIVAKINELINISWWFVFVPTLIIPCVIVLAWIFVFVYKMVMIYKNKK